MTSNAVLNELILEVTNACHHRCIHCSTEGGQPLKNELTQRERLGVLRQACALGLVELRLLGGDPLFRLQDTLELLAEAKLLGVQRVLIYTSAVNHGVGWLKNLTGFSPMQVSAEASIYSASPSIHDGITVAPGSLERLLTSSREAVRIDFDLNWNFVWMKPNFYELEQVVALASEIGIRRVRVLRLMPNGRARENREILMLPIELETQCESIMQSIASRFPRVYLAHSKPLAFQFIKDREESVPSCSAGGGQLVVEADGKVLPCIGMKGTPQLKIGDVREENIEEIFFRSKRMSFTEMSQEYQECPAILYQKRPELIQVNL